MGVAYAHRFRSCVNNRLGFESLSTPSHCLPWFCRDLSRCVIFSGSGSAIIHSRIPPRHDGCESLVLPAFRIFKAFLTRLLLVLSAACHLLFFRLCFRLASQPIEAVVVFFLLFFRLCFRNFYSQQAWASCLTRAPLVICPVRDLSRGLTRSTRPHLRVDLFVQPRLPVVPQSLLHFLFLIGPPVWRSPPRQRSRLWCQWRRR